MKIRTKEQFLDVLAQDFMWRFKELVFHKGLAKSYENNGAFKYVYRSCILNLYSHWEGSIKYMAQCYLYYLSQKQYSIFELKPHFISLILSDGLSADKTFYKSNNFIRIINSLSDENIKVCTPSSKIVKTKSNLNSEVLSEILFLIGLPKDMFALKNNLIDVNLLNLRNKIGHGDSDGFFNNNISALNCEDYINLSNEIISVINNLYNALLDAVINDSHLNSAT